MARRIVITELKAGEDFDQTLRRALDVLNREGVPYNSAGRVMANSVIVEVVIVLSQDNDHPRAIRTLAAAGIKAE